MSRTRRNMIPRKFNRIVGTMLIQTSESKVGDRYHIYKNHCGTNCLGLNLRTGKYAYLFASMLRDADIFKLEKIDA